MAKQLHKRCPSTPETPRKCCVVHHQFNQPDLETGSPQVMISNWFLVRNGLELFYSASKARTEQTKVTRGLMVRLSNSLKAKAFSGGPLTLEVCGGVLFPVGRNTSEVVAFCAIC